MQMGKYELLEELGRGGFATVYKARDPSLDRPIALKVLRGGYKDRADVVKRFLDEARRAAGLRHGGIVRIFEVGDVKGQPYIAMEYLPGGALSARLTGDPLPFDAALAILEQVADALDYAHKRDLVHRDVKPANILFDDEGRAVLVDFGLVKSLVESGLTIEGASLGTPHYMAPEQAQPNAPVDARTDVYALGVVAYEMFAGQVPFKADTPLAVLNAHLQAMPPDPRTINARLDEAVSAAVLKALAKSPADRYPSAGAFGRSMRAARQSAQHAEQTQSTLADLYARAQEAVKAGRWDTVVNLCVEMRNLDPDYRDVGALLTHAASRLAEEEKVRQQERELGERYDKAIESLEAGNYAEAVKALEHIAGQAAGFREVQTRLVEARDELRRAQSYEEAVAHIQAERWADACRALVDVLRERPGYHDGEAVNHLLHAVGGLLAQLDTVRKAFDRQQRDLSQSRETLSRYDALAGAIEAKDWARAAALSEELAALAPELKQPVAWLERAQRALEGVRAPGQDRMVWERDGKEMVRVPAGEFLYGDDKRTIAVDEFWIDKTPITNEEFMRFVEATAYKTTAEQEGTGRVWDGKKWGDLKGANWRHPGGPKTGIQGIMDHPVVQVSWNDAVAYAEWAGKRLPTEEEWEKAARGTNGGTYPWGDDKPTAELCNFNNNVHGTTPIGKYSPQGDSPCGCVDMSGNVWEWTASDYDQNRKVLRGGSWRHNEGYVRAASRADGAPDGRYANVGFRCVAAVPGG